MRLSIALLLLASAPAWGQTPEQDHSWWGPARRALQAQTAPGEVVHTEDGDETRFTGGTNAYSPLSSSSDPGCHLRAAGICVITDDGNRLLAQGDMCRWTGAVFDCRPEPPPTVAQVVCPPGSEASKCWSSSSPTPEHPRTYTPAEIDTMRHWIIQKYTVESTLPDRFVLTEIILQTYILAGVSPEALEAEAKGK